MQIQVIRRFYESTRVSIFADSVKLDLWIYTFGFVYYFCTSIALLANAEGFTSTGTKLDPNIFNKAFLLSEILSWNHLIGTISFFYFSHVQFKSTVILANLRKNSKGRINN